MKESTSTVTTAPKIRIYTNLVAEGWSPASLETGIGGSEEILILLARELADRGYQITVYHNGQHGIFDSVEYVDHTEFKPYEYSDVFISFKQRNILDLSINAGKIIHWTTEIEPKWMNHQLKEIDNIVYMSEYQKKRNNLSGFKKAKVIGNPIDFSELESLVGTKKQKMALYCSSLDRGLEDVLKYWKDVSEYLGINKLKIAYGWDFMEKMIAGNPKMRIWKENMIRMMDQPGVEFVGRVSRKEINRLYAKAKYWVLPLNNPDSELFCINAIKAQYLGAQPLVNKDGALTETVNNSLSFHKVFQRVSKKELSSKKLEENKEHAEQYSLEHIANQWEKILT